MSNQDFNSYGDDSHREAMCDPDYAADFFQYETRAFETECVVCGRMTWETTPRAMELGWVIRHKDTRCPAHTDAMMAFASELQATIARVRGGNVDVAMLEKATIWREVAR
jgi:hypothetical protein